MKKDISFGAFVDEAKNNQYRVTFIPSQAFVTGRQYLIQKIVKQLLQARGSNQFEPNTGNSFFSLHNVLDDSSAKSMKETFPVLLNSIKNKIILEQALETSLQSSEKLLDLRAGSITFDSTFGL